jgi:hypothetical protein
MWANRLATVPSRGDHQNRAAAAMVGVAAVVVAIVVITSGIGGGTVSRPAPSSRVANLVPTPVPRQPVTGFGFSAVDDPAAHQLVLFGGIDSYATTWLWDGRRWSLAHPLRSPAGRFGAAAAYDPLTHVVMLYGGRLAPGDVVDDTWAWDGTTWQELDTGVGSPPSGEGSTMVWDSALDEMVLISGGTWIWDADHWRRQPGGDLPAGTAIGGAAFDPVTRSLVAISCCAPQVATFTWNGRIWRQISTHSNAPAIVSLALDPVSNRLLFCSDPTRSVVGEQMWSWNGTNWIPLAGAQLPALPEAEVTDTDDGHVLVLDFVIEATQGAPRPIHVWSWTGSVWNQRG